jgi:hypothetical protein
MEQKVVITESEKTINDWLEKGWSIVSVTAQHVAGYAGGNTYSSNNITGKLCFVIERAV